MSELAKVSRAFYILHSSIVKNIYDGDWYDFMKSKKVLSKFRDSGKTIDDFITAEITDANITIDELNKFLSENLVFGKHKEVHLYNLQKVNYYNQKELVEILNLKFGIKSINYNELARAYSIGPDNYETLAYVEPTDIDKHDGTVKSIRLIFVKKVKYQIGLKTFYENSYFPIDVDFIKKQMVVKNYPKVHLLGNERGSVIAQHFAEYVKNIFCFEDNVSLQSKYQRALYNMCNYLLDCVIQEKSKLQIENLDEIVEKVSEYLKTELEEKIDINALFIKYKKNIFNMQEQIINIIENVIITKILLDAKGKNSSSSIYGLISYIKFKEKSAVNAVLKNHKRSESLIDSQSYLNIRKTLKETKYIEEIKLIWSNEEKEISMKYDASSNINYIVLHFYRKFLEDDLNYAIKKLYEFCIKE
ncbi:hypothetical protein [Clostridium tagluense]|uniref:hypothetical protein n=1 Tax=Clostridium tagluense TaxID=360422 RepID=UPI001C0D75A7|nr:hypothetical protein [Clostridium tagluense]MBU3129850.1 hypothetical protein [Clostridium tagluense]